MQDIAGAISGFLFDSEFLQSYPHWVAFIDTCWDAVRFFADEKFESAKLCEAVMGKLDKMGIKAPGGWYPCLKFLRRLVKQQSEKDQLRFTKHFLVKAGQLRFEDQGYAEFVADDYFWELRNTKEKK